VGDGVLHLIQRVLIGWGLILLCLWASSRDVLAGLQDSHNESPDASSHCEGSSGAAANLWCTNNAGACAGSWSTGPMACTHNASNKYYYCRFQRFYDGSAYDSKDCCVTGTSSSCNGPYHAYHYYTTFVEPECTAWPEGQTTTAWAESTYPSGPPAAVCDSNCILNLTDQTGPCQYNDANNNEHLDEGELRACEYIFTASGEYCESGNEYSEGAPDYGDNEYNCQNYDCSEDGVPGPGGIGGESDPLPGDNPDPNPGEDDPSDDDDPDTPDHPGTGTGDTTGPMGVPDGERDIDCNPMSNPECMYTGNALGANACENQPSCSGDPVQCAQLYQQWAGMCYDGGDIQGADDCNTPLECDGDVLLCAQIDMQRKQYCAAYVGDGSMDLDVTNDVDFARDLKKEGTLTDVMDVVDTEGFSGPGACPEPQQIALLGGSVGVSFQPMCDLASVLRPLLILAGLLIGYMIIGGKR